MGRSSILSLARQGSTDRLHTECCRRYTRSALGLGMELGNKALELGNDKAMELGNHKAMELGSNEALGWVLGSMTPGTQ